MKRKNDLPTVIVPLRMLVPKDRHPLPGPSRVLQSLVLRNLGLEGTSVSPLQVGYRSTEEIMRFSKSVLGPPATGDPRTATRSGAPVQLLHFTNQGQVVWVLSEALRALLPVDLTQQVLWTPQRGF